MRAQQKECLVNLNRFNVLLAHRRFGKTVLAVWLLIMKAQTSNLHRPQVHYFCPTYSQAKRVAWPYVREFCSYDKDIEFNESELKVTFPNGAILQLGSADNPDANRGIYSDFAVMDEPAQMPPSMWFEVLRPALSDRKGGVLFIGTPAGRHGLFYDLWNQAENDPDYWRGCYRADETGIIDEQELASAQRGMSVAEYAQEFLCSWDAAIKGAYWASEMDQADKEGRIHALVPTYGTKTHIALDLGVNDATASWFFQMDGERIRMIDYAEYTNMGLPHIVSDWKARGYTYGKVICPHDINVTSLSTGQTRRDTLQALGCDVIVAPKGEVIDGINAVRALLPRITFDRDKCRDGIEALRQYRSDWQDKKGVLMLRPLHDWCSHGADAMRYLAVAGTQQLAGEWGEIDYRRMDMAICA